MELSEITKDFLTEILKKFGESGKVFLNEAQFQFELAWKLNEICLANKMIKCKVYLEYQTMHRSNEANVDDGNIKRFFTDILLLDNEGNYVPIELKYKTKGYEDENLNLAQHGANDLGRFDYLWDLKRIQYLKNKPEKYERDKKLLKFVNGFAIMLTNDEKYWEYTTGLLDKQINLKRRNPLYKKFCIGQNQYIDCGSELTWRDNGDNTCVRDTWRNVLPFVVPIAFDNPQKCKWEKYYSKDNMRFQFLILDYNGEKQK